jgi:hypothetical protein
MIFWSIGSSATFGGCTESLAVGADEDMFSIGVTVEEFISSLGGARFSGVIGGRGVLNLCSGDVDLVMSCGRSNASNESGLISLAYT